MSLTTEGVRCTLSGEWGYPIVPQVFVAVYAWFLTQVYLANPLEAWAGMAIIAMGVVVYFSYQMWAVRR